MPQRRNWNRFRCNETDAAAPNGGWSDAFTNQSAVTKAVSMLPADQVTGDLNAATDYAAKIPPANAGGSHCFYRLRNGHGHALIVAAVKPIDRAVLGESERLSTAPAKSGHHNFAGGRPALLPDLCHAAIRSHSGVLASWRSSCLSDHLPLLRILPRHTVEPVRSMNTTCQEFLLCSKVGLLAKSEFSALTS